MVERPADSAQSGFACESAGEGADGPTSRPGPRWPLVALAGGLALSGLWVALLVWTVGRWIGAI